MKLESTLKNESGYTLVESIVAMTLLVGVLLPLGVTVGSLILSDDSSSLYHALRVAQSETCSPLSHSEMSALENYLVDGFPVTKTIDISGDLVTVTVAVTSPRSPGKNLVTLQRSFLSYHK
jgi:hypothetical protein